MAMQVVLKEQGGDVKSSAVGVSWTYFFFGSWVPLLRADWFGFLVSILLGLVVWIVGSALFYSQIASTGTGGGDVGPANLVGVVFMLVYWVAHFVFMFKYNGWHVKRLLGNGYQPIDDSCKTILVARGLMAAT